MLGVLRQIDQERHPPLLVLANRDEALRLSRIPLAIPGTTPEWLAPIVLVVAAQLFCYWLTVHKGLDPERPIGPSKAILTT